MPYKGTNSQGNTRSKPKAPKQARKELLSKKQKKVLRQCARRIQVRQEDSSAITLQKLAQALERELREKRGVLQMITQALEEVRERGM